MLEVRATCPRLDADLVRRPARPAPLQRARPRAARRAGRGRPRLRRRASRLLRRRGRQGAGPTTSRRCSSPRARPATPRASSTPTTTLIDRAAAGARFDKLTDDDEVLAYLPPAWIGQNIFSYAQWLVCGYVVNCPESASTVTIDLKEIGPTYYFAPPRVFEGLLTSVMIRMEDAGRLKRWLFDRCMALARRVGAGADGRQAGRRARPAALRARQPARSTRRCATRSASRACASPTPPARRSARTCSPSTARSAST